MRTRRTGERGAALLTVVVAVTVLTALAVDLAYKSRVSLQIAANARDELKAGYLARSGVTFSRLVLSFQQQLDSAMPQAPAGAGTPGGATSASTATGTGGVSQIAAALAGAASAIPRIQLWNLVPVGSELAEGLFPGGPAAARGGPSFDARIEDEARKVNAQLEGLIQGSDTKTWQQVQSLYQLMCDARWDPLFDRGPGGERFTREDVLVRLRDWVNVGDRSSALQPGQGSTGGACGMVPAQPPFVEAFGDKNQPYDRGDDRYKTKNARMDSLDELYLVAGVGDAFMAAFGDQLTVYLERDAKQNVNVTDRRSLLLLAWSFADPAARPALADPAFLDRLQKAVMERTLGGMLAITPADFANLVSLSGVRVNQALASAANSPFTDRSSTFRIRATGKVGAVESTVDAVVRLDSPQQLQQALQGLMQGQQGQTAQPGQPPASPQQQLQQAQQQLQQAQQLRQQAQRQQATGGAIAAPGRIIHWREE